MQPTRTQSRSATWQSRDSLASLMPELDETDFLTRASFQRYGNSCPAFQATNSDGRNP